MLKNERGRGFLENNLRLILVCLLTASVLFSVSGLIIKYSLRPLDLLMINTCIVGEILAISALLLKNKTLAGISVPPLLWFGVGGRINFSGSWFSAMHFTHALMVLVGLYLIYLVWRVINGEKRPFWIAWDGDTLSIIIIALYDGMVLFNPSRCL